MFSLPRSIQQLIIRKLDINDFLNLRQTCNHFRNARPGIVNIYIIRKYNKKFKELLSQIDEVYFNFNNYDFHYNKSRLEDHIQLILLILQNMSKITFEYHCCIFDNWLFGKIFINYNVTHLSITRDGGFQPYSRSLYLFKNLQYLCLNNNKQLYYIKDLQLHELDIGGNCAIISIAINSPLSRSLRILRITGNRYVRKIDHLDLTSLYCDHSQQHLVTKYIPNVIIEKN